MAKIPFFLSGNRHKIPLTQAGLKGFYSHSEEYDMRAETSFQQILESKIKNQSTAPNTSQRPEYSTQVAFDQEPAHLAFLLGQIGQTFFRPPPPSQTRKMYPSRPKPPPSPHVLNEDQQQAADFFRYNDVSLSPAFSQRELKKAFRTLALKLHPDMNKGAVSAFIELKTHYQTLHAFFS